MGRITLSLVIHNHQPVGNFGHVFALAVQQAYSPLLAALERHPRIRMAFHYTGPLLDWLSAHQPDHLQRLTALVDRGQVEMLGGAYYEPILTAIPDADKAGQLHKTNRFLQQRFGRRPTGAWLAERVWEPHLPKSLSEAGIRYTLLDDTHFKMVGLTDDDLFGAYVTEEQGHALQVFGNSMYLRYAIPWHPVEEVIDWLRTQADAAPENSAGQARVAVMGDDGEKFGLWPGTWDLCWEREAWVERFFTALEANSDWLDTRPLGEIAAGQPPLGRVYLPCASYEEMMQWALPPDDFAALQRIRQQLAEQGRQDVLRFVKGGHWRSFIARYDEVNQMHKKMLWVSRKVHAMAEGEKKTRALDHLWSSQCNCGYWHGLFGGIYLFHIRVANYAHLIAAEHLADQARFGAAPWAEVEQYDVDGDGQAEVVVNTDRHLLVCKPGYGGALVEWDWRWQRYNLLNSMTRRREGYHDELLAATAEGRLVLPGEKAPPAAIRVKERDVADYIAHDSYRRLALLDHFLHPGTTCESFSHGGGAERGDFLAQPYGVRIDEQEPGASLTLFRVGRVGAAGPVRLEKRLSAAAGSDELTIDYQVTNAGAEPLSLRLGVEWNWGIVGGNSEYGVLRVDGERLGLAAAGQRDGVSQLVVGSTLPDLAGEVSLHADRPATLWHFPLEAVTNSEAGYERSYQGTCTLLIWQLDLPAGGTWALALRLAARQYAE